MVEYGRLVAVLPLRRQLPTGVSPVPPPNFNLFARMHAERHELPLSMESEPWLVPATSIYSHDDGMVAWRTWIHATSDRAENRDAQQPHRLRPSPGHHLGHRRSVGVTAGSWTLFQPPAVLRPLFPTPYG